MKKEWLMPPHKKICTLFATACCLMASNAAQDNQKIIERWKKGRVQFDQPEFVVIDAQAELGQGTTIGCGVHIVGASTIGQNCSIGHYTVIKNCSIGDNVLIHSHCVLENAIIEDHAEIGPFAHIEEHTHIKSGAVIGNFVQVKRSTIGEQTKAKHLAYLGDTQTGTKVNIGAGTITCNYNGVSKHKTTIADHACIGSNTSLVAPITIGEGAMTGAGSVITKDVPDHALAIARVEKQVNKENYVPQLLQHYAEQKNSESRKKCE